MSGGTHAVGSANETDRPFILSVVNAAFGRDDEAQLVKKLWAADAVTLEFIAVQDDEIVGYCAFSEVTAKPAIGGLLLGLAPLAVTPGYQSKGVGNALVEYGLNSCQARDAALIVVLGEPAYYGRFGFEPASKFNISWAAMDAGDAFQLIDYADVAGNDAYKIDYHSAFSEL